MPTPWKKKRIAEKEGGLPILDTDILSTFFFPKSTAEIIAQPLGKIGKHTPTTEGLNVDVFTFTAQNTKNDLKVDMHMHKIASTR